MIGVTYRVRLSQSRCIFKDSFRFGFISLKIINYKSGLYQNQMKLQVYSS